MFSKKSLESTAIEGVFPRAEGKNLQPRISNLVPSFLKYAQYELCLSPATVNKYQASLGWVIRDIGDLEVEALTPGHLTELKQKMTIRGSGRSHIASRIFAMKSFLRFCREAMNLNVLDHKEIRPPRPQRREVIHLSNEEVREFVAAIKVHNGPQIMLEVGEVKRLRGRAK